jgi:homoserine O-succinyltransferase
MALLLPDGHPHARFASPAPAAAGAPIRIGIINIMPRLEAYEPFLLDALATQRELVEPVFLRLGSHSYQSSDHAHLDRFYCTFDAAVGDAPLDGLIVTGAPVEELPFEAVHYFRELEDILGYARRRIACTLGLCWGGMAIGQLLGIGKRGYSKKLFGVFDDRALVADHDVVGAAGFCCAHSRHSGVVEDDLERAARAGVVRALSRGEQTGYSMFESSDRRYLAHIGHPEYDAERLAFEWRRDRELGRTDVDAPVGFDPEAATTAWRSHRDAVFSGFVARAAAGAPAAK